jgi:hypothetical protein
MQESKRSALTVDASRADKARDEMRDETEEEMTDETEDKMENGEHGVLVSHRSARVALVVVRC